MRFVSSISCRCVGGGVRRPLNLPAFQAISSLSRQPTRLGDNTTGIGKSPACCRRHAVVRLMPEISRTDFQASNRSSRSPSSNGLKCCPVMLRVPDFALPRRRALLRKILIEYPASDTSLGQRRGVRLISAPGWLCDPLVGCSIAAPPAKRRWGFLQNSLGQRFAATLDT